MMMMMSSATPAATPVNTPTEESEEESRGNGNNADNAAAAPAAEEEEEESRATGPAVAAAAAVAVQSVVAAPHSRVSKLPLARIKALMKADPDVSLASQESVFVIAKATELFVEMIAKDSLVYAQQGKRKTLQRKDLDNAIEAIDEFAFLEGTLD